MEPRRFTLVTGMGEAELQADPDGVWVPLKDFEKLRSRFQRRFERRIIERDLRHKEELSVLQNEFNEYRDDAKEHYGPYGPNCMFTGQFDAGECWLCYMKRKKKECDELKRRLKYTVEALDKADAKLIELRRSVDSIKVRAYELGQKELHDMALEELK